jgi:hypothetical protein
MNMQPSPKIVGAFIVGFAMVAGAYVFSNFGKPTGVYETTQQVATVQEAAARKAIEVSDVDGNGIEDWRDEFITTEPIILGSSVNTDYVAPDTLTGQTGVQFIENVVQNRTNGGFSTDEDVISNTIEQLKQETSVAIYDTPNVEIIFDWEAEDIRTYANAVATAIIVNNETNLENELLILQDILNRNDQSRIKELETLSEVYRLTRDAVLEVPVPDMFVKEHLDLVNALHAVHNDILGMTYTYDDPVYSLLRLRRYEDDIFGMIQALENMYVSLEPYATLFTNSDPAVFFVDFSPTNRIRI